MTKFVMLPAAILLSSLSFTPSSAKAVSSHDIKGIIGTLRSNGYPVEENLSGKSRDGGIEPSIIVKFQGSKYVLSFSDCKSENSCSYIEIYSFFSDIDQKSFEHIAQQWNNGEHFDSIVFIKSDKNDLFTIYHYLVTSEDGISEKSLFQSLEYFARDEAKIVAIYNNLADSK